MGGQFVDEDIPILAPKTVAALSVQFTGSIGRTSRPYNTLLVDLTGTVTAAGGVDAGFGSADIIDRFTLKVSPETGEGKASLSQFEIINNVRFFAFYQFARDFGFVAPITDSGADGGAARVTFAIPLGMIQPTDTINYQFTTNAAAVFHTTATAIAMTLTFRPMIFGPGQGPTGLNTKNLIGYKEYVLDVILASASDIVDMKPGPGMSKWKMGCVYVIRCEAASGTLADGWTWVQVYIGGHPVAGIQTPEIIHKVRASLKTRILQVAGITPIWFTPRAVTNADYFEYQNEATATTRGTTALGVYLVSR